MKKVPYIDYNKLAGYYTIQQVADMLHLSMQELVDKCDQYGIRFQQDGPGHYMLGSPAIKKLHYKLYHESRGKKVSSRRDTRWA